MFDIKLSINVLNGLLPGWQEKLEDFLQSRLNFVFVFDHAELTVPGAVTRAFSERSPEKLERWGIYALREVLDVSDFHWLLDAERHGFKIYFVEQLFLRACRPPQVRPFLVYCDLRGVISDHDTEPEAYRALHDALAVFSRIRKMPTLSLYGWQTDHWEAIRKW